MIWIFGMIITLIMMQRNFNLFIKVAMSEKVRPACLHWHTCKGDIGGPIQDFIANCIHEIFTITSYRGACCFGMSTVYTRIVSYIGWIESIVWP